jgi:hypothetical protein
MIAVNSSDVDKWNEFEAAHTYEYAHAQAKETRLNAPG